MICDWSVERTTNVGNPSQLDNIFFIMLWLDADSLEN